MSALTPLPHSDKPRIAIVGSGISGLTCAYLLRHHYDVHLFESEDCFGGHTATTDVELDGTVYPVNTGFIVFNDWTYPNFIQLLNELDVASEASDMSFSVKCDTSGMEYNGQSLNSLFARRRNLANPSFWRMVNDIVRFNRDARLELAQHTLDPEENLGDYLIRNRYGDYFRRYYIVPMGAAIWSSGESQMMDFPVMFFLRFFNNHGLLNLKDRPQWRVISGGSQTYVRALLRQIPANQQHTRTRVTLVSRHEQGVTLTLQDTPTGTLRSFDADHVVMACHSDQALALLEQPTADEHRILGAIPYQNNSVVLHTDASVLPTRPSAWASWNYHINDRAGVAGETDGSHVAMTYHMNRLQNFHTAPEQFCVTLNKDDAIESGRIIKRFQYAHPVFTQAGMAAQKQHHRISDAHHTHYCGAYWFNGFHEDGVNSALRVCRSFGMPLTGYQR